MNIKIISLLSFSVIILFSSVACLAKEERMTNDLSVQVDHLVVCISNLDDGINQFYELSGIKPVFGGEHTGRGTQNALVSLGQRQYLEILAPTSDANFSFLNIFKKLTPMSWAVSTNNIEGLKEKLRAHNFETSVPSSGYRVLPDGSVLEWSTFTVTKPMTTLAPFFIQWSIKSNHPSKTSPVGCRLNKLELFTPTSDELKDLLTVLDIDIKVNKSNKLKLKIELESPKGMIELETEDSSK